MCSVASAIPVLVLGGGVISTLPKRDILYIIWTAILRRIQICNQFLKMCSLAPAIPVLMLGVCNIHLAKTGHSIYHLDRNFEENSDLKSVFEYLPSSILYGCINACNYHEVI